MIDSALRGLSEKQYLAIIKSDEYKELLVKMSSQIVNNSKSAPNEATIESYFDCELFHFFKIVFEPIGYKYNPVKESSIATRRHITKGRADTAIGALVIEFKQPSKLKTIKQQKDALEQIQEYLDGINNENDTTMIGFVTDGVKGCFVIKSEVGTTIESYRNIDWTTLDRLIQNIVSLGQTALNSRNLVDNFCNPPHNDGIAFDLLSSLYSALSNMTPKTSMLFNEWKELFNLAHDDISKQQAIIDRRSSLEFLLKVKFSGANAEYKALFALQTAYAIIVKIVAYRVVSYARYKRSLYDFEILKHLPADALRAQLSALEEGSIFREYGITNLLEGDFFSWYSSPDQWTHEIANSISKVFDVLSQYSNKAVLNKVERSKDFFKALYETMMPAAVRHSLGEYYTKKWLAQHVVDEAVMMVNIEYWRGLDPCCGSGTFVTVMIDKVLQQLNNECDESKLRHVLDRVKGMDLNPVAVLTARVNYFINVSHLIRDNEELEIPVYLGDSSYVPRKVIFDGIRCLEYSISTLKKAIEIIVPESMVSDSLAFSKSMTTMELHIKNLDSESAYNILISLVDKDDLTDKIIERLQLLSVELVELERNNWDGIWARIITNFLTTANIGRFDVIVGNPPWVDWKSLPSGYRDRIKSLCISRKLFSGDKLTGGINLNICALIANVAAENWLKEKGVLAFLMPEPLVYQPSYEGFRNLYMSNDSRLYFRKFTNWTKAGHPFKPVTQKFLTYYISSTVFNYADGVETEWFILKPGNSLESIEDISLDEVFDRHTSLLATCHTNKNLFSNIKNRNQLQSFKKIAGNSSYIGREGIEFYPQELMIFTLSGLPSTKTCTALANIQIKKSKYHVPQQNILLETEFLHPLIKGVDISPFHVEVSNLIVPFPYDEKEPKIPITVTELTKRAPRLASFYQNNRELILAQTGYNEKIIGNKGEFYALARVGAYSYAENYVVFRDNTKWGAAVVSTINTQWGGAKRPLFQNHAVSICEDNEGRFISYDEAHYICGILNTPVVVQYILQSSDARSFPIRPRVSIPKYDDTNREHVIICALSKEAHEKYNEPGEITRILSELNRLYINLDL